MKTVHVPSVRPAVLAVVAILAILAFAGNLFPFQPLVASGAAASPTHGWESPPAAPEGLNPPANLACLPFPESTITEYNGDKTEGPFITEATQTTVTWRDESDSEEAYRIQRKVSGGSWEEIATLPADSMMYTDDNLTEQSSFLYRVGAQQGDTTLWRESCRKPAFLDSSEGNFRVFYRPYTNVTTECPDVENLDGGFLAMCSTEETAQRMADTLEASYAWIMTGWADGVSFPDPVDNGPILVDLAPCDTNGCARTDANDRRFIGLRPSSMAVAFDLTANTGEHALRVPRHELFHHAQQGVSYGGDWKWGNEATARSTDDKYCLDAPTCELSLDNFVDSWYAADAERYLDNPNRTLFETGYQAALFWTYISEQYGAISDEPQRGVDFFAQFWASGSANAHSHGREVIDFTLADLGHSATFEEVFKDFAVANYAKELPNAPAHYRYEDETQSPGSYGAVALSDDEPLAPGEQYIVDESVSGVAAWGARYFRFVPDAAVPTVDVKVSTKTGNDVYFTLLAIKNGSIVDEINVTGSQLSEALPNNDLDEVALIIAGLDEHSNFDLTVNATQPELRIQDPLSNRPAQGGDPTQPEKFLVKVAVLSPEGGAIAGLDFDGFDITVGGVAVPQAQVINSAYIQGEYWFLVRAPNQPALGSYDLTVSNADVVAGATLSDSEAGAVVYNGAIESDNLIVGDRSGSMNDYPGKLEAAKDAARLYIDAWETGDQIGVVSYNQNADVNPGLAPWSTTQRDDAFDTINSWFAYGGTGIGTALLAGMDEMATEGESDHPWHLFLISDGMETVEDPNIEDFVTEYDARVDAGDQVPTIHAVALGPDADQQAMQQLATDTGGTYEYAGEAGAALGGDGLLSLELAEIYRVVAEGISREQQIFSKRGSHPYGPGRVDYFLHVDGIDGKATSQELLITVKWDLLSFPADVEVRRPDGVQIPYTRVDSRHLQYRIANPMVGDWKVSIFYTPPGEPDERFGDPASGLQFDYLVEAAVVSDLTMDLFLGLAPEERQVGTPMPIFILLSDLEPLPGATVTGSVISPSGTEYPMTYFDDGLHGDGAAGDGLYGNTFFFTSQPGSYRVTANAEGESDLHGEYVRRARTSFYMDRGEDTDQDGLPDHWEEDHDLDPDVPNPTSEDPDGDGLFTIIEFQIGTHPLDADTDNGGESDGSEWQRGARPQDWPQDDGVTPPVVTGWTGAGQNFLTFARPGGASGATLQVFLHHADGTHIPVGSNIQTLTWRHGNLQNGTQYCYQVVTVASNGRRSGSTNVTCLTPRADPIAPVGSFVINGDSGSVQGRDVVLTLTASDAPGDGHHTEPQGPPVEEGAEMSGVAEVMVSNFPDFTGGVWVPCGSCGIEFEWRVEEGEPFDGGDRGEGYFATVYAKYRDAAGNESTPTQDSIWVETGGGNSGFKSYLPLIRR